jgi:hypothetical protein
MNLDEVRTIVSDRFGEVDQLRESGIQGVATLGQHPVLFVDL